MASSAAERGPRARDHRPARELLEQEGRDALSMRRLAGHDVAGLARAYLAFAREHPHLYRLMTGGALPRDALTPGAEERAAAQGLRAFAGT